MQTANSAHVCTHKTPAEYLKNLPAWDGVARLDTWLPHVLGESPESAGMHRMQYLSLAGRQWLLGMVRRVLERGCKFDYCPVLEGVKGTGKTRLLRALVGEYFYSNTPLAMDQGKAGMHEIESVWLYEIDSLDHYIKASKEGIKAFISGTQDAARPPYSRTIEFFPRQFIAVGSCQNSIWRNRTENRRFWPIPVINQANTQWVEEHRDQLFAEAKARIQEAAHMQELSEHRGYPLRSRK